MRDMISWKMKGYLHLSCFMNDNVVYNFDMLCCLIRQKGELQHIIFISVATVKPLI